MMPIDSPEQMSKRRWHDHHMDTSHLHPHHPRARPPRVKPKRYILTHPRLHLPQGGNKSRAPPVPHVSCLLLSSEFAYGIKDLASNSEGSELAGCGAHWVVCELHHHAVSKCVLATLYSQTHGLNCQ